MLVPLLVPLARTPAQVVEVALPLERLPGSIAGKGRGPCRLSSHHGKLIFHSGYTRIPQAGWGDNSIVLALARERGRRGSLVLRREQKGLV
jgi:hypothetical protein